jgi:N-acetylmuramoyl-L-alanine amidase
MSIKYKFRQTTDYIAIHCSATRPSQDIGVADIRRWHLAQGWVDVGYHFVIRRDGTLETGRPAHVYGAHVAGFNDKSIGICLVGGVSENNINVPEENFTIAQFATLEWLVWGLNFRYPDATCQGHRDFPGVNKACPSFDVRPWWSRLLARKLT